MHVMHKATIQDSVMNNLYAFHVCVIADITKSNKLMQQPEEIMTEAMSMLKLSFMVFDSVLFYLSKTKNTYKIDKNGRGKFLGLPASYCLASALLIISSFRTLQSRYIQIASSSPSFVLYELFTIIRVFKSDKFNFTGWQRSWIPRWLRGGYVRQRRQENVPCPWFVGHEC